MTPPPAAFSRSSAAVSPGASAPGSFSTQDAMNIPQSYRLRLIEAGKASDLAAIDQITDELARAGFVRSRSDVLPRFLPRGVQQ